MNAQGPRSPHLHPLGPGPTPRGRSPMRPGARDVRPWTVRPSTSTPGAHGARGKACAPRASSSRPPGPGLPPHPLPHGARGMPPPAPHPLRRAPCDVVTHAPTCSHVGRYCAQALPRGREGRKEGPKRGAHGPFLREGSSRSRRNEQKKRHEGSKGRKGWHAFLSCGPLPPRHGRRCDRDLHPPLENRPALCNFLP